GRRTYNTWHRPEVATGNVAVKVAYCICHPRISLYTLYSIHRQPYRNIYFDVVRSLRNPVMQ
ncbi:hypothetical protein OFM35_32555, partial [Escherichia coli]|nr:hypothetical protein [Escherichia coli]